MSGGRRQTDSGEKRQHDGTISRRTFTKVIGAAAGGLALGAGATGSAAARTERSGLWETLDVGGGDFEIQLNPWGSVDTGNDWDQTIWRERDGSYGYEWGPEGSTRKPNYPEAMIGAKPWRPDTGVAEFPKRRGEIEAFEVTVDIDQQIDGSDWNLALEWWLSESEPPNGGDVDYEIMLVLDAGSDFGHGLYEEAVYTDKYGNTVDWWERNLSGGTSAEFHQFAVSGGLTDGSIDLGRLIEFVDSRLAVDDDLWLSGVEIGNEYYRGVSGETTFNQLDVTINGTEYTSGPGDGGDDPVEKTIRVEATDGVYRSYEFEVTGELSETDGSLEDSDSIDGSVAGGALTSGADIYTFTGDLVRFRGTGPTVSVDGEQVDPRRLVDTHTILLDETQGVEQTYEFSVSGSLSTGEFAGGLGDSVSGSTASGGVKGYQDSYLYSGEITEFTASGPLRIYVDGVEVDQSSLGGSDGGNDGGSGDGLLVDDYDEFPGTNDLGVWTGAGGFEDVSVVDGDLRLQYDNAGWYAEQFGRDISDYSQIVFRVRGATGDEVDDLSLEWGGGRTVLADLTDDTIGTSVSDVAVDLAETGVDPSSPDQLTLNFWQGADSTIWFEEIRLE